MWKPIYSPGTWKAFQNRKDNVGVPLMEVRKKYMEEQLLFENYMSHLQQLDTLHTINPLSSAPGSAPGAAYGRDGRFDLRVKKYFDGTLQSTDRYYRKSVADGGFGTYRYRDTPNFSIDCDYTEIYVNFRGVARWEIRSYPCGAKSATVGGPLLADGPLGTYGVPAGPGVGYIVTSWLS